MTKQKNIQKHLDNLKSLTEKENVHYDDGTEFNIYDLKELMAKELTAIEEIQEESVQTTLTVAELKKMGEVLIDVREVVELYNHALNLVPHGRKIDSQELAIYYQSLYELTSTMFLKNQKLMIDLDDVAYVLSENDNTIEIEDILKKDLTRKE